MQEMPEDNVGGVRPACWPGHARGSKLPALPRARAGKVDRQGLLRQAVRTV